MPSNRLLSRPRNYRSDRKYQAVCADCSAPTTVPFLPTQNRPVYCSPCFKARRDATAPPQGGCLARTNAQSPLLPGLRKWGWQPLPRKPCSE